MRRISSRIPIKGRGYTLASMACGPLACNTFAIICEATKQSIVIDPATHEPSEFEALQEHLDGTDVKHLLLTHGHPDHVAGVLDAVRAWPHATLNIHPLDMENYASAAELAPRFGLSVPYNLPEPTDALTDRQIIRVGQSIELEVLHTPGHAPGHVAFIDKRTSPTAENEGSVIVGGDLLFRGSVGRTDFPNASIEDLFASLKRLYIESDDESIVLTGHTSPTFLKVEREKNPFVASALQRPEDFFLEAKDRNGWA